MTKLIYIANVRMPTEKAHGYQGTKMGGGVSFYADGKLIVPTRRGGGKNELI